LLSNPRHRLVEVLDFIKVEIRKFQSSERITNNHILGSDFDDHSICFDLDFLMIYIL